MPLKIKAAGAKSGTKPAAKTKATSTRSTRTAKSSTAKATGKVTRGTTAKPKPAQTEASTDGRRNRRPRTNLTDTQLQKRATKLEKLATTRQTTKERDDAAVEALNAEILDAITNDVPMSVISEATGISRQWLYKILEGLGWKPAARSASSNGGARKTTAKKTTPARSTSTAKKSSAKPAAKKSSTGTRSRSSKPAAKSTATSKPKVGGLKIKSR